MGMAVLGGLWIPLQIFPAWVANVAQVVPSYWLNRIGQMGAHAERRHPRPRRSCCSAGRSRSARSSSGATAGMPRAADAACDVDAGVRPVYSDRHGRGLAHERAERPAELGRLVGAGARAITNRAPAAGTSERAFGLLYQVLTVIAVVDLAGALGRRRWSRPCCSSCTTSASSCSRR